MFFQTIPDEFVQQHLIGAESCPSSQKALIIGPTGKLWPVELDQRQSDVLYGEVWAEFLTAHDLSEGSILLFRYEVNMSFSVQVFLPNGCMKEYPYVADEADGPSKAKYIPSCLIFFDKILAGIELFFHVDFLQTFV